MLAGQRAARIEASVEDRLGQDSRALGLAFGGVVEDERMEVAVARMEDIADPQAVRHRQLLDAAQHLGEASPRNDAVLHVVVRRHATHRREGGLASPPEECAGYVTGRGP